jgi:hypothetical protein
MRTRTGRNSCCELGVREARADDGVGLAQHTLARIGVVREQCESGRTEVARDPSPRLLVVGTIFRDRDRVPYVGLLEGANSAMKDWDCDPEIEERGSLPQIIEEPAGQEHGVRDARGFEVLLDRRFVYIACMVSKPRTDSRNRGRTRTVDVVDVFI